MKTYIIEVNPLLSSALQETMWIDPRVQKIPYIPYVQ